MGGKTMALVRKEAYFNSSNGQNKIRTLIARAGNDKEGTQKKSLDGQQCSIL